MREWTVAATVQNIPVITEAVDRELETLDCPKHALRQINVALDELLSNIANYAYTPDTGDMTIRMDFDEPSGVVSLTFIDRGVAYNPLEHEDPNVTLTAEDRPIGGLGILMVKKKMDDMEYRREGDQNLLTISKKIREE